MFGLFGYTGYPHARHIPYTSKIIAVMVCGNSPYILNMKNHHSNGMREFVTYLKRQNYHSNGMWDLAIYPKYLEYRVSRILSHIYMYI